MAHISIDLVVYMVSHPHQLLTATTISLDYNQPLCILSRPLLLLYDWQTLDNLLLIHWFSKQGVVT